jgi:hypothetical protein
MEGNMGWHEEIKTVLGIDCASDNTNRVTKSREVVWRELPEDMARTLLRILRDKFGKSQVRICNGTVILKMKVG